MPFTVYRLPESADIAKLEEKSGHPSINIIQNLPATRIGVFAETRD